MYALHYMAVARRSHRNYKKKNNNSKSSTSYKKTYKAKRSYKGKRRYASKKYTISKRSGSKTGGATQCGTGHWKSYGNGPKGSSYMKSSRFIKQTEKMLPAQIQLTDDKFQIAAASAVQNMAIVGSLYTPYDLYNFNGGQVVNTTKIGSNKVILVDYSMIVAFTNQTNANIKVTLYDIIQRRDISAYSGNNAWIANPTILWQNAATTNPGYNYANTAAVPFDVAEFCQYYKVIGSKDYRLAQGETGEHFVNGKLHKVWDHSNEANNYGATIDIPANLSRYYGGFKGLTYYCMAVVQGFPTDNDNATVTTSLAECDFVTTTRFTYKQVNTQNHVATTATNIAAAAGHVFNQGSGADALIANA